MKRRRASKVDFADVFYGVSPDYAVVAQKIAPSAILAKFENVFCQEYGLDLDELIRRLDSRFRATEAQAEQAEAASNQHLTQLDAILASRSWRVTAPLRQTSRFVRWFVYGSVAWLTLQPGSRPRRVARSGLIWAINKVRAHPILKTRALRVLNKFPSLEQRLRRINFAQSSVSSASQTLSSPSGRHEDTVILSPRARQIYSDINEAIKKRDGESI